MKIALKPAMASLALSLASWPASASAGPILLLNAQATANIATLVQAGSVCTAFTYDKNGNRILQTSGTLPSGQVTWGAAVFGCFFWKPN